MFKFIVVLFFIIGNQAAFATKFDGCKKNQEWLKTQFEYLKSVSEVREVSIRKLEGLLSVGGSTNCPAEVVNALKAKAEEFKVAGLVNHVSFMKQEIKEISKFRDPSPEIADIARVREELKKLGHKNIPSDMSAADKTLYISKGKTSSAKKQKSCTNKDNRKPPLATVKDGKVVKNNMRNQDSIGWCYAYSAADMLSHKMGQEFSAIDVANAYNDTRSVYFWENEKKESELEGGYITKAANSAKKRGVCLEKNLPSCDFKFADNSSNYIKQLRAVEGLYDTYYKDTTEDGMIWGRNKKIGGDLDRAISSFTTGVCRPSYPGIAPLFPEVSMDEFVDVLGKSCSANDCVDRLVDMSCKPRVKIPENLNFKDEDSSVDSMLARLDKELNQGDIAGILYSSKTLYDRYDYKGANHASTIVARRFNTKTNSCEYMIRNSWGSSCGYSDPRIECTEGNLWMPEEYLRRTVYGVTYVD